MATNLTVRNVDDEIAKALKERAASHGVSAEAEHRAILADALCRPQKQSFKELLASMPDIEEYDVFERVRYVPS